MSADIEKHAVELLWKQWTAVGVAGVARPPQQAIDLEAMIALTPYIATADPRLADESIDWCLRIGKSFISISRLRQLSRLMPPRAPSKAPDLVAMLLAKGDIHERGTRNRRLSGKSRLPTLQGAPWLLQLRSRYIFGVGARADVVSALVMRGREAGADRASALRPTGYTKQAVATVLDELASAGVLKKLVGEPAVRYAIAQYQALQVLLGPLPKRMPPWAERFAIVAHMLETWRSFGSRATYVVESAKVLERIRPIIAAAEETGPSAGHGRELGTRIERWAIALLDDDLWAKGAIAQIV